uniref:Uncharacterized protein n=1 Tax=Arundo donax TaxID=35708 RepID=A0A0A9FKR5_ARUDO
MPKGTRKNWMHLRQKAKRCRLHLDGITKQIGIILLELIYNIWIGRYQTIL